MRSRAPLLVGLVCTAVYFGLNDNASPSSDGSAAVPTAVSILHDGDLRLDEYRSVEGVGDHYTVAEVDGHLVSFFPWPVAIAALPAVVIADVADAVGVGLGADDAVREAGPALAALQHLTAAVTVGVAIAGVYVLLRRRLADWSTHGVLLLTTVVAFGTSAWSTAAVRLWQHGPSLAATTWALVLLDALLTHPSRDAPWRTGGAGALLMAAVALRPTNALFLVAATFVLLVVRRRALPAFLAGVAASAAPWVLVTAWTYGSPLQPYSAASRLQIHGELGEALIANLVSPGRGLLIFTPVVVFCLAGAVVLVRSRDATDPLAWMAVIVVPAHWIVISAFPHWWGGFSYGPRLFTDVAVLLVLLGLPVLKVARHLDGVKRSALKVTFVAMSIAGIVVHAQGALIASTECWSSLPVSIDDDHRRIWSWSDPLFTRGLRDAMSDPGAARRGECPDGSVT